MAAEESIITSITGKVFNGDQIAQGRLEKMTIAEDAIYTQAEVDALLARDSYRVLIPKEHPKETHQWVGYNGIGYLVPCGAWTVIPDVIFEILESKREMLAQAESKMDALEEHFNQGLLNPASVPTRGK